MALFFVWKLCRIDDDPVPPGQCNGDMAAFRDGAGFIGKADDPGFPIAWKRSQREHM